MQIYKFRDCLLNTVERRVLKDGKFLDLTTKTFDVLQILIERTGGIVTKDEILGTVWGGSLVEEGNLPVHISKLRKTLGESKSAHFIQTVQGIGYRITSPVQTVDESIWRTELNNINTSLTVIPNNSESHQLYLKGKYFSDRRTIECLYKALEYFEKSISCDPTNTNSYVEMINCYILLYSFDYLSYSDVTISVNKIVKIISKLGQLSDNVHVIYGIIKIYLEWKFEEGEEHLRQALKLNPYNLVARYRLSQLLITTGKFTEALVEVQEINLTEPLSPLRYKLTGRLHYVMGRYEDAVVCLNDSLELEPDNYEALIILGAVHTELKDYELALSSFYNSLNIHYNVETLSMIGYVKALEGKRSEAYQIVSQITSQPKASTKHSIKIAKIYLALGDKDVTYELLDLAYLEHDSDLLALKSDPRWASIRNEIPFKELIKRVGL